MHKIKKTTKKINPAALQKLRVKKQHKQDQKALTHSFGPFGTKHDTEQLADTMLKGIREKDKYRRSLFNQQLSFFSVNYIVSLTALSFLNTLFPAIIGTDESVFSCRGDFDADVTASSWSIFWPALLTQQLLNHFLFNSKAINFPEIKAGRRSIGKKCIKWLPRLANGFLLLGVLLMNDFSGSIYRKTKDAQQSYCDDTANLTKHCDMATSKYKDIVADFPEIYRNFFWNIYSMSMSLCDKSLRDCKDRFSADTLQLQQSSDPTIQKAVTLLSAMFTDCVENRKQYYDDFLEQNSDLYAAFRNADTTSTLIWIFLWSLLILVTIKYIYPLLREKWNERKCDAFFDLINSCELSPNTIKEHEYIIDYHFRLELNADLGIYVILNEVFSECGRIVFMGRTGQDQAVLLLKMDLTSRLYPPSLDNLNTLLSNHIKSRNEKPRSYAPVVLQRRRLVRRRQPFSTKVDLTSEVGKADIATDESDNGLAWFMNDKKYQYTPPVKGEALVLSSANQVFKVATQSGGFYFFCFSQELVECYQKKQPEVVFRLLESVMSNPQLVPPNGADGMISCKAERKRASKGIAAESDFKIKSPGHKIRLWASEYVPPSPKNSHPLYYVKTATKSEDNKVIKISSICS